MGVFQLYPDKSGRTRFRLKADNGGIILASEAYTTRSSALNGIASVKLNATNDGRYERKATKAGHSFNLKAANHRVVGTSEVYTTEAAREKGIAAVKKAAPTARVEGA